MKEKCIHHWVIETPDGRFSKGVCSKCGNNKLFDNVIEDNLASHWKVGKAQYA